MVKQRGKQSKKEKGREKEEGDEDEKEGCTHKEEDRRARIK